MKIGQRPERTQVAANLFRSQECSFPVLGEPVRLARDSESATSIEKFM
jgi:hypothetical protein